MQLRSWHDFVQVDDEGNFLIEQAWEARGDGLGPTVAQPAMETFHERLRAAEVELVKAHRAEPNWSRPAACMIDVCRGLGHEREEMEKWFERAMRPAPPCDGQAICGTPEIPLRAAASRP